MLRRLLSLFGLALKSDLRAARIHGEASADVAMIWQHAAYELRGHCRRLERINVAPWYTDNTTTQ